MMDKEIELEEIKATRETRVKSGQKRVNKAKHEKLHGEEEGLEIDAERAKMPPTGSKEKVTELGWQTRRVLSATAVQREPLEEGSCQSIGRLSPAVAEGNG